ncbi:MAG: DUF3820 family protein [Verrucomicrobiota bacterium]|nr:DUF3820 family protein [Verrucomicrobiota bacterium]
MNDDGVAPEAAAAAVLEQISRYHMPFGMFGPKHYPPKGVPIYDLPAEYLAWFALKGFPEGRLGELLQLVYQTKADGCDGVFDAIRRKAGGRYRLRKPRGREWKFD